MPCYVCDGRFHCECRYEDVDAYKVITDNKYIATCSDVCDMKLMPFNGFKFGTLVRAGIFHNNTRPPYNSSKKVSVSKSMYAKNPPIIKDDYKTKFVKFDRFLDINCSYLNPTDIDESIYDGKNSNLSVFHCNVRTLNNFDSLGDIFMNCNSLPDI